MKKYVFILIGFLAFYIFLNYSVDAKVLPRYQNTPKKSVIPASTTQYISAKLRDDRKALLVTFSNLQNTKTVEYILTYSANGVDQGVTGTVDVAAGNSATRTIVFGTESKGVYTYHTNIKNMKFVVTIVPKSGKTVVKKYTVKP